jgi:hypothetical protein
MNQKPKNRKRGCSRGHEGTYKASVIAPLLKCIIIRRGKQLLKEIHEGSCGSHNGSRALVGKAFRQGFYWPTTINDAALLV